MRAIVADHRLDDIQPRRQLADRNHHIARTGFDEITATAFEIHALRRLDHLRVPDRVAKARDHVIAFQRRELRVLFEMRRLAGLLAELELRRGFGRLAARRERQHALPRAARLGVPAVPQIRERVREPFALVIRRDIQPMQILLRLQELQRLRHAIHDDVRAAIPLQRVLEVAAGRFEPHLRQLIAAEARIGKQEERLTVDLLRIEVARRRGLQASGSRRCWHRLRCSMRCRRHRRMAATSRASVPRATLRTSNAARRRAVAKPATR